MKAKVYGGNAFLNRGQCRVLVGARSQVEALKLLHATGQCNNMTLYYFRGYWCETGNDVELAAVKHGEVWTYPDVDARDGLERIYPRKEKPDASKHSRQRT